MLSIQGILQSFQTASEATTVIEPYAREIFINECPLFSRLPSELVDAPEYTITSFDVRQRLITLAGAIAAVAAGTTVTLAFGDVSQLQVGDIIEIYNTAGTAYERSEVLVDPNVGNNTVSVMRGVEGTTPVANDISAPASNASFIMGNSRTGSEVDQTAFRSIRTAIQQYVQTQQYAVQVGGLPEAVQAIRLPQGFSSIFSLEQKIKMTEFVRDTEYSMYYGLGQSALKVDGTLNGTGRRKMVGLRKQIATYQGGLNYKANGGTNYTRLQFLADTVLKCLKAGGNPDVLMTSVNFAAGFATWGQNQAPNPMNQRTAQLGLNVEEFIVTFLGKPMKIIPSFQLRDGSAVVLTSSDVKMRHIRQMFFQKRGLRGDAWEGDFIGDYSVELGHPGWHSWVEGINTFA